MTNSLEAATKDLRDYLAANPTPDPKLVALLTGVIERAGAAAPVEPGFVPPVVDSTPERTTRDFLAQAAADEGARRADLEAGAIFAAPAFDREEHDAERKKAVRSLQLGGEGLSYITGMKP